MLGLLLRSRGGMIGVLVSRVARLHCNLPRMNASARAKRLLVESGLMLGDEQRG